MNKLLGELVGWYGAAAIVLAYVFVSFSVIDVHSLVYQLLNLTGATGIVVISAIKKTYQPAAVNIIWAVVAAVAILQIAF